MKRLLHYENEPCTNDDQDEDDEDDQDDEDEDDSDDKVDNNDNKSGNNGNKPSNNKNKQGKNDSKPGKNDNKESRQMNFAISLRKCFLNNITKIIKLVDELNDEIYDDDQWLVFAQLNKTNLLFDELIDRL